MKKLMKLTMTALILSIFCIGFVFASGNDMKGHDMGKSDKFGDLIHESVVDGYMLSYYFMDLRGQKDEKKGMDEMDESHDMKGKEMNEMDGSHDMKGNEMDKPHHLMLYVMDKNHQPVLKGKVGFLIKDAEGNPQKAMGMFMSNGFGTTADMKKKGVYTITTKAVLGDKQIMDKFDYEIK